MAPDRFISRRPRAPSSPIPVKITPTALGPAAWAAELPGRVPAEEAQARLEALQELQRGLTLAAHRARVGQTTEILLEGASRRPGQVMGRDPYHRVVNLTPPPGPVPRPGQLLPVRLVEATPHSLIGELEVKETRGLADEAKRGASRIVKIASRTGSFSA